MPISFNEIPYSWFKPGTYVEVRPFYGRQGLLEWPAKILVIAPMLASGQAAPLVPQLITRPDQAAGLFGTGSIGQAMIEQVKAANRTTECHAIGIADLDAGTQATGTITVAGTATESGIINAWIDGKRVRAAVPAGATATAIAASLAAAINADASLPVTAAAAAGVVTLTSRHKGTLGNSIPVRIGYYPDEFTPAGITSITVTPMAGGVGDPDIAAVFAAIQAGWYTDIVVPYTDSANMTVLDAQLAARYAAMGKLDAHAYVGLAGTVAQLNTWASTRNSPYMSVIGMNRSPSAPWRWAAAMAAVATFHLTNDPARQLRGLALPGLLPPREADRFSETEQELLLRSGISSFEVLNDGTVALDRVVTSYRVSPLGITDRAWLDIMMPKTASHIRHDWASHISLMYPRHKLTNNDSPAAADPGNRDSIVTPRMLHASWGSRCTLYEQQGWIEDARRTVEASVFERNANDRNRVDARQVVRIIGNLMVLSAALEIEV